MEDPGPVNQRLVHLLPGKAGIRAGLPGEGEGAVAGFVEGHEGKGGKHRIVQNNALGFDAGFPDGMHQKTAEGVGAHLADEGGFLSAGVQGGQKIRRSAAGIGGHGGIAGSVHALGREINEQFA